MRLIDADALKEDIDNLRLFKKWIREEIKQHINNAPTVEIATKLQQTCNNLQQRQGEWIEHGKNYDSHSHRMFVSCECSACHMYEDFPEDDETGNVLTSHYCEYCGSNMWKEEQE